MPAQTTPITERQRELIARAYAETAGLIEPLLALKGGAKLKMITGLAQRGLIEQVDGQWRLTPAAMAIVEGKAQPAEVLPPPRSAAASPALPPAHDPELEAAVAAAEANGQANADERAVACAKEGAAMRNTHAPTIERLREHSKLATIIDLLRRKQGATIQQMAAATGWQAHSVRGALTATIKHRLGLPVLTEKPKGTKAKVYRLAI